MRKARHAPPRSFAPGRDQGADRPGHGPGPERAEQASADRVKAADGTPLNVPIFPPPPSLTSASDIDDMRRAMELRKELGDDRLRRLYFAIGRLLGLADGT